ncbi:ABC transporter permease [Trueperella pyogenes]|uniref:ABC transporter permease n=1 Tax=Trueperella pyogenes TaxID=1661 RepID=UPI0024C08B22|nr:hypothetical protein [Trueperella pyogenes]WHU57744.1 hypothetical protein QEV10_03355 [Trueperella pyogenes]
MLNILKKRESIIITGVILLVGIVGLVNSSFVSIFNLGRIANSSAILILLAAGSVPVIVTKNIDVSVGSVLALSGIVGGLALRQGIPALTVALIVALFAGLLGLINGVIVAYGHVPSIVATLGTMAAFRGISFLITGGYSIEDIPPTFTRVAQANILSIPVLVWVTLIVAILLALWMAKSKTGRHIYATGGNVEGARLVGVSTGLIIVLSYIISGIMAGLAACVFMSQVGSISNQAGQSIEMQAIAAAVIGGVALTGGVGTVVGALFGAIFITAATSAMSFLGVPGFWSNTVVGAILLAVLFVDAFLRKSIARQRLNERYAAFSGAVAKSPRKVGA